MMLLNSQNCTIWKVYYILPISDFALKKLTQEAYWITSWGFQLPFAGLDFDGCKYLRQNCTADTVTDLQPFSYPIEIKKAYPAVSV